MDQVYFKKIGQNKMNLNSNKMKSMATPRYIKSHDVTIPDKQMKQVQFALQSMVQSSGKLDKEEDVKLERSRV